MKKTAFGQIPFIGNVTTDSLHPKWVPFIRTLPHPRVQNESYIDEHLLVVLVEFQAIHGLLKAFDLGPIKGVGVGIFSIDSGTGRELGHSWAGLRDRNKISCRGFSDRLFS